MGGREGSVGGAWAGTRRLVFVHSGSLFFVVSSFCVFECTFVMCISKVLNSHDVTGVWFTLVAWAGATERVVPRTTVGSDVGVTAYKSWALMVATTN